MSETRGCRRCRARFIPKPTGRPRLYCSPACRKAAARKRARTKPYHLTGTDEWETPPEVFAPLHAEFGFTLDVCATDDNAKCERYFTKADDGLAKLWVGVCWMNPPYSEVARWVAKAAEAARGGSTVVYLVRSTTDTAWWHEFAPLAEFRPSVAVSDSSGGERGWEHRTVSLGPAHLSSRLTSIGRPGRKPGRFARRCSQRLRNRRGAQRLRPRSHPELR
jgi:hypothetical protein